MKFPKLPEPPHDGAQWMALMVAALIYGAGMAVGLVIVLWATGLLKGRP